MKKIYLDHAATTPVDPEVFAAMEPYFKEYFGNAGSVHSFGQEAIAAIDRSREVIAKLVNAEFRQIVFVGSATEANNLAIRGAVAGWRMKHANGGRHRLVVSSIEHESVIETARALEKDGVDIVYLPVDKYGRVDLKVLKENLTPEAAVVSIMYANNEIGTVQDIRAIAEMIKEVRGNGRWPLFHTDAAQALQFLDCDARTLGADLMTLSSHKIYGPKGAAALFIKDPEMIEPVTTGGGQEFGLRSGTENVAAVVGFAKAAELAVHKRAAESERIAKLRDELCAGIKKIAPKIEINGPEKGNAGEKLPNILNIYMAGYEAQDALTRFDLKGLAASSGSACRSRAIKPSYVIEALGYDKARARSSIRFSLGRPTTEEDIKNALEIVRSVIGQ